jgi:hypothetical protein
MARQIHLRRAQAARVGPASPSPQDERTLAELAALRAALAGLEQKLPGPQPDAKAITRALDPLRRKLEELAAGQGEQRRQLLELASTMAARRTLGPAVARAREAVGSLLARARGHVASRGQPLPAAAAPPPAPPRASSLLTGAKRHGDSRTVLALLLGLSEAEQAALVARLGASEPFPGLVPVFVTDRSRFEPFRRQGAFFEHLPPGKAGDGRDWELYRLRRFGLLCTKWQPLRVVAFGAAAREWLAQAGASPHLPGNVRALLRPEPEADASAAGASPPTPHHG